MITALEALREQTRQEVPTLWDVVTYKSSTCQGETFWSIHIAPHEDHMEVRFNLMEITPTQTTFSSATTSWDGLMLGD